VQKHFGKFLKELMVAAFILFNAGKLRGYWMRYRSRTDCEKRFYALPSDELKQGARRGFKPYDALDFHHVIQ
jgi:hypothetical protein